MQKKVAWQNLVASYKVCPVQMFYLSAGGCTPGPMYGDARWSGCPWAPCPSSRTETWSSAAARESGSRSDGTRRCCTTPAGKTRRQKFASFPTWFFFVFCFCYQRRICSDFSICGITRQEIVSSAFADLVVPDHSDVRRRSSGGAVVRHVIVFGPRDATGREEQRIELHAQRPASHVLQGQPAT